MAYSYSRSGCTRFGVSSLVSLLTFCLSQILVLFLSGNTALAQSVCSPISTLECSQIAVPLPVNLNFNDPAAGTLADKNGIGTGFTMVDAPSARLTADNPVYNANVPGYEPGKLSVSNGQLIITATKGISYSQPSGTPSSTETNSQINALGVGVEAPAAMFSLQTTLAKPAFANATSKSEQGGLWFGLNEDRFAKLVLVNLGNGRQKVQLTVENIVNQAAGEFNFTELNTGNLPAYSSIKLRMELNPATATAKGYYSLDGGAEIVVETGGSTSLAIPTAFLTGTDHDGDADTAAISYAGIFTSMRRATSTPVNFAFDDFSITPATTTGTPALAFGTPTLTANLEEGSNTTVLSNTLTASDASQPVVTLSAAYEGAAQEWLTFTPSQDLSNGSDLSFTFDATGLAAGTYTATITASAEGYTEAVLAVALTVTEAGTNPATALKINFSDTATPAPQDYINDIGQIYGMRTTTEGYDYGWLTTNGQTGLDLTANTRNRGRANIDVIRNTLIHMQYGDTGGTTSNTTEGIWEIAVPNGNYEVTVTVGDQPDPKKGYDSKHSIRVEGLIAISQFQATAAKEYETKTIVAFVTDGRLTIDANGGFNTKMNAVEIVSVAGESNQTPQIAAPAQFIMSDPIAEDNNEAAIEKITLKNTGTGPLTISNIAISGTNAGLFSLPNNETSLVIPAGGSYELQVAFQADAVNVKTAVLTLSSDHKGNAGTTTAISLRGLGTAGFDGSDEPSLQWVLDVHGIAVNVGDDDPATNVIHSNTVQQKAALLGDEVSISSFSKADETQPVTLQPLSVFGPTAVNPIVAFGWYETGNTAARHELFTVDNSNKRNGQTVHVAANGNLSFDPGTTAFGFYNQWPFFNNRLLYSEDALNTFTGAIPHHVRVYPLPGEENAYIIATEEHTSGFDYQDVVVIARNVKPAAPKEPEPVAETIRINFSDEATPAPVDHQKDYGLAYGDRGNSLTYGWVSASDPTLLLSLVGNGRNRLPTPDQDVLKETLMHMQYNNIANGNNGVAKEGIWEIALTNGSYEVTVGVGDAGNETVPGTRHMVNAEGINVVNVLATQEAANFTLGTKTVDVADGKLTLDATGGFNTKINYVVIVPKKVATEPVAAIRINAGGTAAYTDGQNNVWQLDGAYVSGSSEVSFKTFNVAGTTEDPLFLEYRYAINPDKTKPGLPFSNKIKISV